MVFSAAGASFQKPASAVFASRSAIRPAKESKPPPGFVDFCLYFLYGSIQFSQQHDNLSIIIRAFSGRL